MNFSDLAQASGDGLPMADLLSPEYNIAMSQIESAQDALGIKQAPAQPQPDYLDKQILDLIDAVALE